MTATTTHPATAGRRQGSSDRATRTRELFSLALSTDSADERRQLLDTVIEMHLDLAHSEAGRYRSRGIPLDDLRYWSVERQEAYATPEAVMQRLGKGQRNV